MKFFLVSMISIFILASCSTKTSQETYKEAIDLYNKGMYIEAEQSLHQFVTDYAKDKNYPNALFLRGFILANHLNKLDSARAVYGFFLKRYPQHELTPSVKFELQNLGKSPDFLLDMGNEKADSLN